MSVFFFLFLFRYINAVTFIAYVTGVIRAFAFAEKVVVKRLVAHASYKFSDCRQIFRMFSELVHHCLAQQLFTSQDGIQRNCGIQLFHSNKYVSPVQRIIFAFFLCLILGIGKAHHNRFVFFVLQRLFRVLYTQ